MKRRDYAFPFRVDHGSGQGAEAPSYEAHVEHMIRQVLLTSPGERANLPLFGCGLRKLLFAPSSEGLTATARILVLQALRRWLAGHIDVKEVHVGSPEELIDESRISIRVDYVLRETREQRRVEVQVQ